MREVFWGVRCGMEVMEWEGRGWKWKVCIRKALLGIRLRGLEMGSGMRVGWHRILFITEEEHSRTAMYSYLAHVRGYLVIQNKCSSHSASYP